MAIIITDECINCGACEPECPNTAIYEGAAKWKFSDGTGIVGQLEHPTAGTIDADAENEPIDGELNYEWIIPQIDKLGYKGYAGAEYNPKTNTDEGISWLKTFRKFS